MAQSRSAKASIPTEQSGSTCRWRIRTGTARSRGRRGAVAPEARHARPMRRSSILVSPENAVWRSLWPCGLERPITGGPPRPRANPVVANRTVYGEALVDSSGHLQGREPPRRPILHPCRGFATFRVDVKTTYRRQRQGRPGGEGRPPPGDPIPWPGLIGAEGYSAVPGPWIPTSSTDFVQASLEYFKIPRHLGRRHQGFQGRLPPRFRRQEHGNPRACQR